MPKLPGISYLKAVRAFEKAGFRIVREGKHTVMSDGVRIIHSFRATIQSTRTRWPEWSAMRG